jgi:CubicO group peptidase (beta-lactamase class C family)
MPAVVCLILALLSLVAAPADAAEKAASAPTAAPTAAPAAAAEPGAPSASAHPLERADVEAWLDGYMPYALDRGNVAGGVVAVVKDGEVLLAKGYGYADVDARKPVDPERTMFRPGSVSKLFTWTAVMQLVERGKLDLDRDVNGYLDFHIPDRADGPITLRDIMTHTAGFEEQIKALITDSPKPLQSLADYARTKTPTRIFKAGSTPAYSNYATALAGYIVERASGLSFDDYIDANIFKPLGMEHSTFRQPLPERFKDDMSNGYSVASEPAKPYEIVTAAPAGSLAASGGDMAKFMIAHLQGGEYHGNRILSAETAKLMHETPLTMIPPLNRMMLGFYEQNYNGHRVISHGGDTQFMHSYLHLFLDDHVGLFVSVNSVGREGAAGAIRSALFDGFVDRYFPGPATAPSAVTADTAAAHARLLAGFYEDSRRPDTSFLSVLGLAAPRIDVNKDGTVSFSMLLSRGGAPRHYREFEPFVWRDTTSNWRLAARVVDGQVVRISADELSPFMVFEPIPWWRSPAWLKPVAGSALTACLLTALLWPVAAIVRRRLGTPLRLTGAAARGRLASRIAAAAITVMTLAWVGLIGFGMSRLSVLTPGLDPWLMLMYALSVIVYLGSAAAAAWASYVVWTNPRPWTARVWTTILGLSAVVMLYVAWLYHLMSFVTRY